MASDLGDFVDIVWQGSSFLNVTFVPLAFLFIKITFFLLFLQVFKPFRWVRISWYVRIAVTSALYGALTVVQFILLTPRPGETWLSHAFDPQLWKASIVSVPMSAVGLGLDIFIFLLPTLAVLRLQISSKRKAGVIIIFGTGFL